jgi:type I restriction enzyme R subunit
VSPLPSEFTESEKPLLDQLQGMGWTVRLTAPGEPADLHGRETFREVLLRDHMRVKLQEINLGPDDQPWLDESRLNQMISELDHPGGVKLLEVNQGVLELLLKGTSVEGRPDWDSGKEQHVRFIDFDHWDRNEFLAVNQFRVKPPGERKAIIPDVVLFVNGIPLVVIECKSPAVTSPIEGAIDQLRRYSNGRGYDTDEGVERLFWTNQILVAAAGMNGAKVACIGAAEEHFLAWKDTSPTPMALVAQSLGKAHLNPQEILVAGMLRPVDMLDLIRHFIAFKVVEGKTIKIVARYQQFRAVQEAVHRLTTGQVGNRSRGIVDRRGGIIWHTQGSGKSLTMVFLVRKLRTMNLLSKFKVVVVTDRTDLEKQFADGDAGLIGDKVRKATNTKKLRKLLEEDGPGLIFAMIQKYQQRDAEELELDLPFPTSSDEVGTRSGELDALAAEPVKKLSLPPEDLFPELNTSSDILVLIDEAHRSQASSLHANLLRALPNCARIAFTGTPILAKDKKNTLDIFGDFIDRYTIRQSEEDKATVPILYEGREVKGVVKDGQDLDDLFRKLFEDRDADTQEAIKAKYANASKVLEAEELIQAKARDMLGHYAQVILPNGLKAQVVATSRLAAMRYHQAFQVAHKELVAAVAALSPAILALGDEDRLELAESTQVLLRVHPYLATLKRLDFAAIISGDHNDPPSYAPWTDKTQQDHLISRFKKPLHHKDHDKQDGLAFLIVKSMLLTGFDAPVEQGLYLDRIISQPHEILQAIARVNRTCKNKKAGRVIDYIGKGGRAIQEALKVYDAADVEGALEGIEDQVPLLRDRHQRVKDVLKGQGVEDITKLEDAVLALRDERVRADFVVKLKAFLETLDTVMPDPAGLPFVRDAKILGFIARSAASHYRDGQVDLRGVGEKVRKLIDDHIRSQGVEVKVEPISILDVKFDEAVNRHVSDRAKASEMEHALRAHIRQHFEEDPVRYQRLSERLEQVLTAMKDNWVEIIKAWRAMMENLRHEGGESSFGLDPRTQAPFTRVLLEEMGAGETPTEAQIKNATEVTVELVDHMRQEIRIVDFWRNPNAQGVLKGWVFDHLDRHDTVPFNKARAVADRLVDLAKALHDRLVE